MGAGLAFYLVITALLTTRRRVAWLDLGALVLGLVVDIRRFHIRLYGLAQCYRQTGWLSTNSLLNLRNHRRIVGGRGYTHDSSAGTGRETSNCPALVADVLRDVYCDRFILPGSGKGVSKPNTHYSHTGDSGRIAIVTHGPLAGASAVHETISPAYVTILFHSRQRLFFLNWV